MVAITGVTVQGVINDVSTVTIAPAVTSGQTIPIDSDGYVLLVQFDSAVTIADETKVTVNLNRPGNTGTVGGAATTRPDVAFGVKQPRRVYPNVSSILLPGAANAFYIAVDNLIHASDAISSIVFAVGFFAGQSVPITLGSGVITNSSTLVYDKPRVRPVFKPYDRMGSSLSFPVEFVATHEWANFGSQVARVEARCKVGSTYGPWTGTSTQARSPQTPAVGRLPSRDDAGLGGVNGFDSYAFNVDGTGVPDGAGSIVWRAYGWFGDTIFDSETDGDVYGTSANGPATWPFVKDAAGLHTRIYAYVNRDGTGLAGTSAAGVSSSSADPGSALSYTSYAEAAKAGRLWNNTAGNRATVRNDTSGLVILLRDVAGGALGDNASAYWQRATMSGYSDGLLPLVLASASYLTTGTTTLNCRLRPVKEDGTAASSASWNGRIEHWGLKWDGSGGTAANSIVDGANAAGCFLTRVDCDLHDNNGTGASIQTYRWGVVYDFRVKEGGIANASDGPASTSLGNIYLSVGSYYAVGGTNTRNMQQRCLCSVWCINVNVVGPTENSIVYGLRVDANANTATQLDMNTTLAKGAGVCNVFLRAINPSASPIARIGDDGLLARQLSVTVQNLGTVGQRLNIEYNDQGYIEVFKRATLRSVALDSYNNKAEYFAAPEKTDAKTAGGWTASTAVAWGNLHHDNNATLTARVYYQALKDFTTGTDQATDLADTTRWQVGGTGSVAFGPQPRRTGAYRHRHQVRNFYNFYAASSSDTAISPTSWFTEAVGRGSKVYNATGIGPHYKRHSATTLADFGDYRPKSIGSGDSIDSDMLNRVPAGKGVTPNDLLGKPYRTDGTGAAGPFERTDGAAGPTTTMLLMGVGA